VLALPTQPVPLTTLLLRTQLVPDAVYLLLQLHLLPQLPVLALLPDPRFEVLQQLGRWLGEGVLVHLLQLLGLLLLLLLVPLLEVGESFILLDETEERLFLLGPFDAFLFTARHGFSLLVLCEAIVAGPGQEGGVEGGLIVADAHPGGGSLALLGGDDVGTV
jgi:hypothetical protein